MKIGDSISIRDKVGIIKWVDKPYMDSAGNDVDISVKVTLINETPEYLDHKNKLAEVSKILAKKRIELAKLEKDIEATSHFMSKFENDEWTKLSQIKERNHEE